jgi:outer membrane protein assembly factor BamB
MRSRVLVAAAALASFTVPMGAGTVALSSPTAAAPVSVGEQDATAYQMTPGHTGASDDQIGPDWTKAWSVVGSGPFGYALIADQQVFALIDVSGNYTLIAYDATTGAVNWSVSVSRLAVGITYASGRVFVQNSLGGGDSVSAYDAGTGTLDWSTVVPNQIFTSAPTAANGDVYADGASTGGDLYAFRQSDGAIQWDEELDGGSESSPAANGSEVLASFSCDLTQAFDPTSGDPQWTYAEGCDGGGGQTAVLADGDVFLRDQILSASTGQTVRSFTTAVAPAVDTQNAYTENDGTLQAQTVTDGTVLWSQTGDDGLDTSPIEVNGVVYEGSSTGQLYGYSAETGQQLWSDDIGTPLNPNPFGNYQDSAWSLSEGDDLLAVPAGDTLTVFDQSGTPPNAPSGVSATGGQGQADVNWTVPADNGNPITDFTITPSIGGVAGTPFVVPAGGPSQPGVVAGAEDSLAVTGLTNGTTYTFTVSADSVGGASAASAASGAVTPGVPLSSGGGAPTPPTTDAAATTNGPGIGYTMAASDGGIFNFGEAGYFDSQGGKPLDKPVVGIATTPNGGGYWEVASDGGIFAFGDAHFYGSMGGKSLDSPIVGIAATPDGGGYWEVASDGGIFAFGDAHFYGSMGGRPLDKAIVGIAATPDGGGYWEVASDGGIFAFGDAHFYGSMGGRPLNAPVVSISASSSGHGYLMVSSDGGLFAFGDAPFYGAMGGHPLNKPIVGIVETPDGDGYWEVASDGGIFNFGDAAYYGSQGGKPLDSPVVGIAGE